jgi:hypothetical protein
MDRGEAPSQSSLEAGNNLLPQANYFGHGRVT